jgi:hypothetical protein
LLVEGPHDPEAPRNIESSGAAGQREAAGE